MKTVQGNGGTIPLRTSKNPVLGVYRHHCGHIATVHAPKGRKAHLRYLQCDNCGTDQCAGKPYQDKIRENMQPNIEALEAFEVGEAEQHELTDKEAVEAFESGMEIAAQAIADGDPKAIEIINGNTPTEQPIETNKDAVSDVVEQLQQEPKPQHVTEPNTPAANDPINPKKLAGFAVVGAIVGGLLALAK
ncbi:hypothetical protein PCIT_a3046 [Pseudoalteromonas citrea]|uniref:Uncharacterized protein n=3 Tax=Pseudoalteromonas TaxID=53246 RepID=A0A5S3V1H4_9GAMM|nr:MULTISPECIES: hypothetical protein [Pseudoalteromonas]KAF7770089.1 hypothetical protein PCIT_a3046 [Pseudoalteromonas citrea]TMO64432.1 hypothetical protein CWC19_18345 [Pseudoalteromonas aurantia]